MSTTTTTTTALQASATITFISQSSSSSSSSSSSPSSSSSSSSSPSSTSSSSSSSSLNGTSVFIMVSVSLVVLLLVISLIIVYRWKYTKITGPVSSTHRVSPDTGNHEGGCHGDGDYEEIMERPLQSDSTIYATANLPTSHFDSPHYASVTFHKTPSCPNEARVTTAKEGTSSCDYATVNCQIPTYSTVNHPHCSSEAPPI
ncbi:uncharacterized protein LOC135568579 [Oncorhynchus nerka]|uniref:uncharacterized protein LOC135568579 n=1 Tax=Oncorhynchus nerka TaxID=8023 RepID=UPI0031B83320